MLAIALTYEEVVVRDLRLASPGWVCGALEWYANFRPCYAQTISKLRLQKGWDIESEICKEHPHRGNIHHYRLRKEPGGVEPRTYIVGRIPALPDGSCGCDCHAAGPRPNGCRFCFKGHHMKEAHAWKRPRSSAPAAT